MEEFLLYIDSTYNALLCLEEIIIPRGNPRITVSNSI
jgi:hypothetical protein